MIRLAKTLILVTALLLPAYLLRFSILGIPTTALEILIVTTFVVTTTTTWGRWKFPPRQFTIATVLFVLAAIVSTLIAPDKRVALGILKAWIIDPVLLGWVVYQFAGEEKFIRALISMLVGSGTLVALTAIYQRVTGDLTADGRALGIYGYFPRENASPNFAALYMAPIGALAFALAAIPWSKVVSRKSIVFWISFLLIAYGLWLTDSRGGLIGLGAGAFTAAVLYFWDWIRARSWAKAFVVATLFVTIVAGWQIARPNFALSPVEGGRITSSNNLRWEIWKTTAEILKDKWVLGVGLGNYQDYFTEFTLDRTNYPEFIAPLALTPHNLFLAVWVNLGLLGLMAFVWLVWLAIREGIKNGRSIYSIHSIALIASMSSILIHGLVDTPYFKNDLSAFFWILIAGLVALGERRK